MNKVKMLRLALGLMLLTVKLSITAAEPYHFGRLTLENGLAGESAFKVLKDCSGLMWIATSNGVNIFDGATVSKVKIAPIKPHYKSCQNVFDICEIKADHTMYIATDEGIFRLGVADQEFRCVLPDMGRCQLLSYGERLIISNTKGLHIYDHGKLQSVEMGGVPNVRAMTLDKGMLYVLTSDALCRYIWSENRLQRIKLADMFAQGVSFSALVKVGDIFYIGTKNAGLYQFQSSTGKLDKIAGVGNVVNALFADGRGMVCVSTDGSGAFLVDGKSGKVMNHYTASSSDAVIDTNAIYYYWCDDKGNPWFCQAHFGLAYSFHVERLFQTYRCGTFTTQGMPVRSFLIEGHRKLIGTQSGLYIVDEQSGKVSHFTSKQLGGGNIVTGIVRMGLHYYVGTYDGGLHRIDARTFEISKVESFVRLRGEGTITVMRLAPDGKLWIGTNTGVVVLDGNEHTQYYNADNSVLNNGSLSSITFAPDGSRWLAGAAGLSVMTPKGTFLYHRHYPTDYFNKEGYLMGCSAPDGKLYMGNRNGIFFTDLSLRHYGKLNLPDGIIDERCNSIYYSQDASLWVTSEKGLFRISADGTTLMHFGDGVGMQSHHFLKGGITAAGDTLWVAAPDGLKWMVLKKLKKLSMLKTYKVLLTQLMLDNTLLDMPDVRYINIIKRVRLNWNISSQVLKSKVVLDDFANPDGRLYEYRVDKGENWKVLTNNEELVLDHLSIGRHQLMVRMAGMPGTETTFHIDVIPSTAFIIEMVLVLVVVGLMFAWKRYHKRTKSLLSERNDIADALVEMDSIVESLWEEQEEKEVSDESTKYQQMRMGHKECEDIVARMKQYIEKEGAYRNPELKRVDIAQSLGVPVAKLSYVFSQHLKINYYDFINHYRLEEFKQLIAEGEHLHYTIQALSERCGFKKSSFFSTFKKVEGMTPTEYLRQHKP